MDASAAYQLKCQEISVPVDEKVVKMFQAGPAHLHLAGRATVRLIGGGLMGF